MRATLPFPIVPANSLPRGPSAEPAVAPASERVVRLRTLLQSRPLRCDGAMGTQLQSLGLPAGECSLRWNVTAPERVTQVHRSYLEAGADLLTTNTFSGNTFALAPHDLAAQAAKLNRAGTQLARSVAGERAFVLGDIGPLGELLEPYGDVSAERASAAFQAQAAALLEGGADAILVETMSDPAEAALAVRAARAAGAALVLATFTFQTTPSGFRTMMGPAVGDCVRAVIEAGADVVGANCGTALSLDDYTALARELVAAAGDRPVLVQPNAGAPTLEAGRAVYHTSVAEFAAAARRFLAEGVRLVGGCCGTTPAHIAALRDVS